jgi:hypothetical protein
MDPQLCLVVMVKVLGFSGGFLYQIWGVKAMGMMMIIFVCWLDVPVKERLGNH